MFKVNIIESEAGWGSKVDEVLEFETLDLAQAYVKEYNNPNLGNGAVPDWYMIAQLA